MADAELKLEQVEGDFPKESCPHCDRDMDFIFNGHGEHLDECAEDTERTCAILMYGQCGHCLHELYRLEYTVIQAGNSGAMLDVDGQETGEKETRYLATDGNRQWRLVHYENTDNIRMYIDGEPETRISAEWLDWHVFNGLKGWPLEDRTPEDMACALLEEVRPLIAQLSWNQVQSKD
jgi:hypothetical protein